MNELIKIKDMTSRYDISARTLRYYEDMGLIESVRDGDYPYRMYDEAAVKRVEQILILRRLNIRVKDIRRVFGNPSSGAVLEVLDQKIGDIDDEVALLHELKEVILSFIQQIKNADFSKESDVTWLYEKAKDLEAQLVHVDYDGNPSNVNRLLEVTAKLERKPEIVKRLPHFYLHLHVSDPVAACDLYRKAFGAEITSHEILPQDDHYIMMEINDFSMLVRPGEALQQGCSVQLASEEDLRRAYDLLIEGGKGIQETHWHWTPLLAHVTDRYHVEWMLCI